MRVSGFTALFLSFAACTSGGGGSTSTGAATSTTSVTAAGTSGGSTTGVMATSGGSSGGSTGGASTGCTPGDGGDCPFCGPGNFVVSCPSGVTCPRGAGCGPNGDCLCPLGTTAEVNCDGGACTAQTPCRGQDWWCAPLQPGVCGPLDATVVCDAGAVCPTHGQCEGLTGCGCQPGYVPVSCSGQACNAPSPCPQDGWQCVPAVVGGCGIVNFTVPCTDSNGFPYQCPTDSSCNTAVFCSCNAGFTAFDCTGAPCGGDAGACSNNAWWCVDGGG